MVQTKTAAFLHISLSGEPGARWTLAFVVLLSSVFRITAQLLIPGYLKGDDLEIIEDAVAPFGGFPTNPWAIRSLFVSRVIVRPWVWLAKTAGADNIDALVFSASVPFIVASAVNIVLL